MRYMFKQLFAVYHMYLPLHILDIKYKTLKIIVIPIMTKVQNKTYYIVLN